MNTKIILAFLKNIAAKKGFTRWLLHSFRTEQLLGCGGFVLVANQHTNLVPQRNNGKYRPMA